jgi:hypothetical protein
LHFFPSVSAFLHHHHHHPGSPFCIIILQLPFASSSCKSLLHHHPASVFCISILQGVTDDVPVGEKGAAEIIAGRCQPTSPPHRF